MRAQRLALDAIKRDARELARGQDAKGDALGPVGDVARAQNLLASLRLAKDEIRRQIDAGSPASGSRWRDWGWHDALTSLFEIASGSDDSTALIRKLCQVYEMIGDGRRTRARRRLCLDYVVGWRELCATIFVQLRHPPNASGSVAG